MILVYDDYITNGFEFKWKLTKKSIYVKQY